MFHLADSVVVPRSQSLPVMENPQPFIPTLPVSQNSRDSGGLRPMSRNDNARPISPRHENSRPPAPHNRDNFPGQRPAFPPRPMSRNSRDPGTPRLGSGLNNGQQRPDGNFSPPRVSSFPSPARAPGLQRNDTEIEVEIDFAILDSIEIPPDDLLPTEDPLPAQEQPASRQRVRSQAVSFTKGSPDIPIIPLPRGRGSTIEPHNKSPTTPRGRGPDSQFPPQQTPNVPIQNNPFAKQSQNQQKSITILIDKKPKSQQTPKQTPQQQQGEGWGGLFAGIFGGAQQQKNSQFEEVTPTKPLHPLMVLNPQPNQIEMDYAPFLFELNKNRFLNSEIEFETNLFIKLASFSLIVSQNSQIQNSVQFIPVEHLPPNFVNNSDIILGIQDLIQEIHEMDSKLAMIQYVRLARPDSYTLFVADINPDGSLYKWQIAIDYDGFHRYVMGDDGIPFVQGSIPWHQVSTFSIGSNQQLMIVECTPPLPARIEWTYEFPSHGEQMEQLFEFFSNRPKKRNNNNAKKVEQAPIFEIREERPMVNANNLNQNLDITLNIKVGKTKEIPFQVLPKTLVKDVIQYIIKYFRLINDGRLGLIDDEFKAEHATRCEFQPSNVFSCSDEFLNNNSRIGDVMTGIQHLRLATRLKRPSRATSDPTGLEEFDFYEAHDEVVNGDWDKPREQAAQLMALHLQINLPDSTTMGPYLLNDQILEEYLCPRWRNAENIAIEVCDFYHSLRGMPKEEAIAQYLKIAYSIVNYGEVHFCCQHSSNGMELLAIGANRVARLDITTRALIAEWDYSEIKGTHPNLDNTMEQTQFLTLFTSSGQNVWKQPSEETWVKALLIYEFAQANSRPVVLPPAFQPFQFIERMEGELVKTSEEACIIS